MAIEETGERPAPGDLYVLAATADLPVEWALLDRRPSGELLAVPADTCPLAGSADVEIEEGEPGGPLVLRCRFGVWLAPEVFAPEMRTGALSADRVADALRCWRQGETGRGEASPLAEEVDVDPEYVDWIRDVPERARELAAAARPAPRKEARQETPPARPGLAAYRLAASLALVSIGLSVWVVLLRQEVGQLKQPILNPASAEVSLGGVVRGEDDLLVPPEARHVRLILVVGEPSVESREGSLEIVKDGHRVWHSDSVKLVEGEDLSLIFRREELPDGDYEVRLHRSPDLQGTPVLTKIVRIKTAPEQ